MTRNEFDQWLETHSACFPGVGSWLASMWDEKRVGVLSNWWRQLQGTTLDDAASASRAMADDEAKQPIGFGNHGISVRDLAQKRKPAPPPQVATDCKTYADMTDAERADARAMIAELKAGLTRKPKEEP